MNQIAKDKSPKYVRNVHGLLSAVLKEYNPALILRTSLPQKIKYDVKIPSSEEIRVIFAMSKGTIIELPVYLSVWLGLRLSELRSLRLDAYTGETIEIKEAIVTVERKAVSKGTKTYASQRVLSVPEEIRTIIDRKPKTGEYIITASRDAIYKKFVRLCKQNELPHYRFYDLRPCIGVALGIFCPFLAPVAY